MPLDDPFHVADHLPRQGKVGGKGREYVKPDRTEAARHRTVRPGSTCRCPERQAKAVRDHPASHLAWSQPAHGDVHSWGFQVLHAVPYDHELRKTCADHSSDVGCRSRMSRAAARRLSTSSDSLSETVAAGSDSSLAAIFTNASRSPQRCPASRVDGDGGFGAWPLPAGGPVRGSPNAGFRLSRLSIPAKGGEREAGYRAFFSTKPHYSKAFPISVPRRSRLGRIAPMKKLFRAAETSKRFFRRCRARF